MSQHLPAIAAKLAPARAIIDFINGNLDIHELACYTDDMECTATFRGCEPSVGLDDDGASSLAANAFCEAYDLLPEGYGIALEDKRFIIVRQTPEEMAELAKAEEAEAAGAPELHKEYVCFRFEPAAMAEFDADGDPVACYGYRTVWRAEGDSEDTCREGRDYIHRKMAKAVATSIENVTPITVEEYLAAGGTFEEVNPHGLRAHLSSPLWQDPSRGQEQLPAYVGRRTWTNT